MGRKQNGGIPVLDYQSRDWGGNELALEVGKELRWQEDSLCRLEH
jgi:hypothetical protein